MGVGSWELGVDFDGGKSKLQVLQGDVRQNAEARFSSETVNGTTPKTIFCPGQRSAKRREAGVGN